MTGSWSALIIKAGIHPLDPSGLAAHISTPLGPIFLILLPKDCSYSKLSNDMLTFPNSLPKGLMGIQAIPYYVSLLHTTVHYGLVIIAS